MKPTVYGIDKTGFDPESDVDIVLWQYELTVYGIETNTNIYKKKKK